ncbi:MAG: HAD-IIIA family hydrolase [Lachnospiraceae bacterium]|nr:HAD-IIIA family hydrolase [Lachnospiraceae bacterium]
MAKDYIAVIQAGGKGTRMEEITGGKIPKPMISLNGRPMLEWQIENIKKYGIHEFVIIIGHLGEKVKEYFGDGSRLGVQIRYIEEQEPLGSAGALFFLKSILQVPQFLLVFGDVMFDLDLNRMMDFHEGHGGKATLLAHPNSHPYDSDLLVINDRDCVTGILPKGKKRDDWYENCVNAGIYILSSDILECMEEAKKQDLEKDVLKPLIVQGEVFGYRTPEYVKDAGTPARFYKASREQQEHVWARKNLEKKQACVFLDRDGTVNRYKGLIASEEQLELEDGAAEGIQKLNEAGFLVILVTNQPVVARGMCGIEDVKRIHRKLQVLLGEQGAYLDDITFCPHHPDKGYPEENPAYKIICKCRKPATGMIETMAEKYNIDLSKSYIAGDTSVDIQTGKNAGLKTILVLTGQAGEDGKYCMKPDITVKNLSEAAERILG